MGIGANGYALSYGEYPKYENFDAIEVSKKLNQRIAKELDITLAPLRNAFAELQFKENFPTLNDKRWYPDQPLVDHVVESNDFRKILKKWHKIDGLKEFANIGQNKPLLEETIKLLDIAIVNSFEPGATALHSQHTIVKELLNEIKVQFQKEKSKPDLNRIIELYTKSVIRKWDESKDKTLPEEILEARIYDSLFPSTQRLIAFILYNTGKYFCIYDNIIHYQHLRLISFIFF